MYKQLVGVISRSLTVVALGLSLGACSSISFERQDVVFDFDPEADTLTVDLAYYDIGSVRHGWQLFGSAPDGPDLKRSEVFLRSLCEGGRVINLVMDLPWPEMDADLEGAPAEAHFAAQIQVLSASLTLGTRGELNATQQVLVPNIGRGLELVNEVIAREFGSLEDEIAKLRRRAVLDMESRVELGTLEIMQADIEAGFQWVRLTEEGLVLAYPIRSEHLVSVMKMGLLELEENLDDKDTAVGLHWLQGPLSIARDLRIEADHLVLIIGDREGDFALSMGSEPISSKLGDFRLNLREHIANSDLELPVTWVAGE